MDGAKPYQLSAELRGHEEDVRSVCIGADDSIVTGSRDKTVKIWRRTSGLPGKYELDKTLIGHTSFVGTVSWLPPSQELPNGAIASGGMDKQAIVWDPQSATPVHFLQGHEQQVTGVAATSSSDIVTSSVDKTGRLWRQGKCVGVLTGHESSVLAVLVLPSGDIVTGSSDRTIKFWRGGVCVHTISAHLDTVRGLALMPGVGVVSASHDGTVKLWAESGELLLEMLGHSALVYSVTVGPQGAICSCSEDNTAKIWQAGACQQTLEHPGCVWDAAFLANGDLVTACADGVARVWTTDPARAAEKSVAEAFAAQLSARQQSSKTAGGVKVEDLPGPEALQQPGKRDGQTKLVREGDAGMAYSWSASQYQWEKIGVVVDEPRDVHSSKELNGASYDYVFDVDIGDGVPARKLPYNLGENPYDVADRWLLEQDLPAGYREQVVQFIVQNTGQATPSLPAGNSIPDPYTGGQAYLPGAAQPSWAAGRQGAPQQHVDPYTGAAAYTPAGSTGPAPAASPAPPTAHIPQKVMLLFEAAQFGAILKKVDEFNKVLAAEEATLQLAMGDADVARLQAMTTVLMETWRYHVSTFADLDYALLARLLQSWPSANLFPVLDLLRMVVLHPSATPVLADPSGSHSALIEDALKRAAALPVLASNQLTGLRTAVNCFRQRGFRGWLRQHRAEILDLFSGCQASAKASVRLAWATLILNYSLLLTEEKDEEGQIQAMSAALEMAGADEADPEVRFRALTALGSLILKGSVKSMARDLDVAEIAGAAAASDNKKIAEVGKELAGVLA